MNIIICVLIISCFTYLGFGFSDYYVKREKLFYDLSRFCEKLKADIGFLHTPLKEIFNEAFQNYSSLEDILYICLNIIDGGKPIKEEVLYPMYSDRHVNDSEKKLICGFFSSLGKSDGYTQIENIENYYNLFSAAEKDSLNEKKKFSPMYKKLGFLCGAAVCLFII
jgi:stage III sporulation protein AB